MKDSSFRKPLARVLLELSPLLKYLEQDIGVKRVSVELTEKTCLISWDDSLRLASLPPVVPSELLDKDRTR